MQHFQFLAAILLFVSLDALAVNYPCSGKKGGVSHCAGPDFICVDGSISKSKKVCSFDQAQGFQPAIQGTNSCSCRSHQYCTGPRGGQYCLDDSGSRSYRQR
ncbi:hypothetical protein E2K99_02910 [Herbaspirillum huttiense]|nr:hypothetical protein E2K99_02910 [Herbaspirillum huttiense]